MRCRGATNRSGLRLLTSPAHNISRNSAQATKSSASDMASLAAPITRGAHHERLREDAGPVLAQLSDTLQERFGSFAAGRKRTLHQAEAAFSVGIFYKTSSAEFASV